MSKLNTVKVMFENSKHDYETNVSVSSTEKDCQNYFVGRMINVGSFPDETMAKCIKIKFNNQQN
jgi:hypothetical protein